MPELRFNSDGAVDGATLDTGQARPDAFDVKRVGTGAVLEYENQATMFGQIGWQARAVTPPSQDFARIGWTSTAMGVNTEAYWRHYVSRHQMAVGNPQPNQNFMIFQGTDLNTTPLMGVRIESSSGTVSLVNGVPAVIDSTAASFYVAGSWMRVEVKYNVSTGAADVRLFKGGQLHDSVPNDVLSGTVTTGTGIGSAGWGLVEDEVLYTERFDECAYSPVNWIGPVTLPPWGIVTGNRL